MREHEEFVWLHDRYAENEEYAGIIVSIVYLLSYIAAVKIWKLQNFTEVLFQKSTKNVYRSKVVPK